MAAFRGSYTHSIDHKGRVSIPARFRRLLSGEAGETFVILRGLDACVWLYPSDEFKKLEERADIRAQTDDPHRRAPVALEKKGPGELGEGPVIDVLDLFEIHAHEIARRAAPPKERVLDEREVAAPEEPEEPKLRRSAPARGLPLIRGTLDQRARVELADHRRSSPAISS